jgi:hypothetical protein
MMTNCAITSIANTTGKDALGNTVRSAANSVDCRGAMAAPTYTLVRGSGYEVGSLSGILYVDIQRWRRDCGADPVSGDLLMVKEDVALAAVSHCVVNIKTHAKTGMATWELYLEKA